MKTGMASDNFSDHLKISPMKEEDLDWVLEIEQHTFSEPWSREGFLSSLKSPDTIYLAAFWQGRGAGYCGLLRSFEEADITNVAVAEALRGRGVGRHMLKALMQEGKARGICRFTLEVRVSNHPAIRLYETLGFEPAGVRRNFYRFPTEDGLIMWTGQQEDARTAADSHSH